MNINNITFDELWEILYAIEDKAEQIGKDIENCKNENDIKELTEKQEYLNSIAKKIETRINQE